MALERGTDVEYIGNNSTGGQSFGLSSTELISFYGATPIAKATVAISTTATTTVLRAQLTALHTAVKNLGLIA